MTWRRSLVQTHFTKMALSGGAKQWLLSFPSNFQDLGLRNAVQVPNNSHTPLCIALEKQCAMGLISRILSACHFILSSNDDASGTVGAFCGS
ncbi:hypothetical protein L6164_036863 [Bauhinia variegata]|uniref:Uncharacterized protein n=1 Tax=Bauhinia variegata TaxID=167791 RepID=A0ACB9KIG4_BAUVA|nr:hypothetical protein L6164_036863 [Bauhinia variegata]